MALFYRLGCIPIQLKLKATLLLPRTRVVPLKTLSEIWGRSQQSLRQHKQDPGMPPFIIHRRKIYYAYSDLVKWYRKDIKRIIRIQPQTTVLAKKKKKK